MRSAAWRRRHRSGNGARCPGRSRSAGKAGPAPSASLPPPFDLFGPADESGEQRPAGRPGGTVRGRGLAAVRQLHCLRGPGGAGHRGPALRARAGAVRGGRSSSWSGEARPSQRLLLPITVDLNDEELDAVETHREPLEQRRLRGGAVRRAAPWCSMPCPRRIRGSMRWPASAKWWPTWPAVASPAGPIGWSASRRPTPAGRR